MVLITFSTDISVVWLKYSSPIVILEYGQGVRILLKIGIFANVVREGWLKNVMEVVLIFGLTY